MSGRSIGAVLEWFSRSYESYGYGGYGWEEQEEEEYEEDRRVRSITCIAQRNLKNSRRAPNRTRVTLQTPKCPEMF